MGQETLSGSYKCVEEMKVSWGVRSCAIGKVGRVESGRALHVHDQGGLGKCKVGGQ